MWNPIRNSEEIETFMEQMCYFHDSCIKELKYTSGAYVNCDLSMYPINSSRILRVVIQRQHENNSMIELEFDGLKLLILSPIDDTYTCEIESSSMFFNNGYIYWCDHDCTDETELSKLDGTMICALKLRWRAIENHMGSEEYYHTSHDV